MKRLPILFAAAIVCSLAARAAERPPRGYLIVTTKTFASAADEFASWKRTRGFKVEVLYVDDSSKSVGGIREKILKIHSAWREPSLDYVLLLGDDDTIPCEKKGGGQMRYVTDLPYSTLVGDDYFPDVGLGRIPVRLPAEAEAVIGKMIRYERGEFRTNDWIGRAAFITPKAYATMCEGASDYCIELTRKAGYTGSFPKGPQPGGDRLYAGAHDASTPNLVEAINQGRGIILYQGHGLEWGWGNPRFGQSEISAIKAEDALPFVISVSCLTGRYDYKRDCMGESWIKHERGAVAFFGASGNSLFPHCLQMQAGIFDAIFKDGKTALADICDAAKRSIYRKYGNRGSREMYEMYHLFGDPSMELRLPAAARGS